MHVHPECKISWAIDDFYGQLAPGLTRPFWSVVFSKQHTDIWESSYQPRDSIATFKTPVHYIFSVANHGGWGIRGNWAWLLAFESSGTTSQVVLALEPSINGVACTTTSLVISVYISPGSSVARDAKSLQRRVCKEVSSQGKVRVKSVATSLSQGRWCMRKTAFIWSQVAIWFNSGGGNVTQLPFGW